MIWLVADDPYGTRTRVRGVSRIPAFLKDSVPSVPVRPPTEIPQSEKFDFAHGILIRSPDGKKNGPQDCTPVGRVDAEKWFF